MRVWPSASIALLVVTTATAQVPVPRALIEGRRVYLEGRGVERQWLDQVAGRMTPDQVAEAQRRAREWTPTPGQPPPQAPQLAVSLVTEAVEDADGKGSTWRVIHDHLSSKFLYGCQGEIFVSAQGVRFESDESDHSFNTVWQQVELVSEKPEWGWGAFSVLLRRPRGRTYNFGMATEGTDLEDLLEAVDRVQR